MREGIRGSKRIGAVPLLAAGVLGLLWLTMFSRPAPVHADPDPDKFWLECTVPEMWEGLFAVVTFKAPHTNTWNFYTYWYTYWGTAWNDDFTAIWAEVQHTTEQERINRQFSRYISFTQDDRLEGPPSASR